METLNGIKLESHDLKREGNEILYFKQLQNKSKEDGNHGNDVSILSESVFNRFDYLLVTPKNEIMGVKGEDLELLYQAEDVYKLAQDLFVSG